MKKIIIPLIITLILTCVFIFFKHERNDNSNAEKYDISNKKESPAAQENLTKENPAKRATPEKSHSEISTENPVLPSSDDIDNRFSDIGTSINFVEKINQLLKSKQNDKTGESDIKIAKILEICENAPKNDIEVQRQKKNFEQFASENGRDNGQIQAGLASIEQEYKICLDVRSLVSGKAAYDYYKNAADLGQPVAQVAMATRVPPPNYDSLTKENKIEYQQKMGKLLGEARARCEPTAFLAFGYAGDTVEQQKLWTYSEDVSPAVSEYGNIVAYILFYSKKVSDGEYTIERYNEELKIRHPGFSQYETENAINYGNSLYKKYCGDN